MPMPLLPEFDIDKSDIQFFIDWTTERFVKTVHPKRDPVIKLEHETHEQHHARCISDLGDYYKMAHEAAIQLWLDKYGDSMPENVEGQWAEVTPPSAIHYEGNNSLTEREWDEICRVSRCSDLTYDMLWFVVEGLDWKPGAPVSKDDPQWDLVWIKDDDTIGYIDIVYDLLNMPGETTSVERKTRWDTKSN